MRKKDPNLEALAETVTLIGPLSEEMVFLGGCATGLLLTDPAAPPIRTTLDVDVIVEVTNYFDYYKLGEKLRGRGFREDTTPGAPLCRWKSGKLILDVMPTNEEILGFGNRWYGSTIENAVQKTLPTGDKIRMVSAPYFLATKIEAAAVRAVEPDTKCSMSLSCFASLKRLLRMGPSWIKSVI